MSEHKYMANNSRDNLHNVNEGRKKSIFGTTSQRNLERLNKK
jgi:hypothetical protein